MAMKRPKTMKDYRLLVEETLFDVDDLRAAAEFDEDDMGGSLGFLDPIERDLRQLLKAMTEGGYRFGGQDLPSMDIVKRLDLATLPFKIQFTQINETHTHGLEEG